MAYNRARDALKMPKSSTVDDGVERGMSRSDNVEGSTVRTPFSVAQQALTRLTNGNWIQVADEILSVGQSTDEELSELANMVRFCANYTSCTLPHSIIHVWRVLQRARCAIAWRLHAPTCLKHNLTVVLHTMCLCVCWLSI